MYTNLPIKKISLYSFYTIALVWVVLLGFDWGSTYITQQKQNTYETVPFELKIKSAPEDVLYSEAFSTADGREIVKYAYAADEVGPQLNEDITRRTSTSYTEVIEKIEEEPGKGTETLKTTFFSKPQFYEDNGQWRQIEYATTTPEVFAMSGAIPHIKKREWLEKLVPGAPVFAVTSTFYPNPHVETSSVDGVIQGSHTQFYIDCLSMGGNVANDALTSISADVQTSYIDNDPEGLGLEDEYTCTLTRAFVLFDTSSLPDTAIISSATISVYVLSRFTQNTESVSFSTSNPSSNTALGTGDFDSIGGTTITNSIAIGSLTNSTYNVFSFNSGDLGVISRTGVTKTAFRLGRDIAGSLSPDADSTDFASIAAAETSGTSQDPKLEVTYTESFSMGFWFPF